jgi:hypothetical protein
MESSFDVGKGVVIDFVDVNVRSGRFFAMLPLKSRKAPPDVDIGMTKKGTCVLHKIMIINLAYS